MPETGNIFDDQTTARLLAMLADWEAWRRLQGVGQPFNERLTRCDVWRWGKLDGNLVAGSFTVVSLWRGTNGDWRKPQVDSGINWEECYAPFVMTTGTILAGKRVGVCDFGTRKIVMLHEC